MNILSIQSWVNYGHVGNASAVFPLQRVGAEVWAINTVQFSNHPGYGHFTGEIVPPAMVAALIEGIAARGVLAQCDALLSGYVGDPGTGAAILAGARRLRAANPDALWACDPVIGDVGEGIYVKDGIEAFFRDQAVGAADILTPNMFELGCLTGMACGTHAQAKAAIAALRARMPAHGPRVVLVTSYWGESTPEDCIDLICGADGGTYLLRMERLPIAVNGAGDAVAALFLFHLLDGKAPPVAMSRAASAVFGLMRQTWQAGSRELLLVAAQAEYVNPTRLFEPGIL